MCRLIYSLLFSFSLDQILVVRFLLQYFIKCFISILFEFAMRSDLKRFGLLVKMFQWPLESFSLWLFFPVANSLLSFFLDFLSFNFIFADTNERPLSTPVLCFAITSSNLLLHLLLTMVWSIWFLVEPSRELQVVLWMSWCIRFVPPVIRLCVPPVIRLCSWHKVHSIFPLLMHSPRTCSPLMFSLHWLIFFTFAFNSPEMNSA